MTTTDAQWRKLFGQPAAWDLFLIRPPRDLIQAARVFIEAPELCNQAVAALRQLARERNRPAARPTKCLLCEANFLKAQPALVAIMKPATRDGDAVSFLLCGDCAAAPNLKCEQAIRAKLHRSMSAQTVDWGTA
jgi:hypothetical protein